MAAKSSDSGAVDSRNASKTLAKGLGVLAFLAASGRGLRASEVARELDLNLNTAIRLLTTLEAAGFANKDTSGLYTMGARVAAAAVLSLDLVRLTRLARPQLTRLRDLTGETVTLAARFGASVVAMDVAQSPHMLCAHIRVGSIFPLFPSTVGYVLTADLPLDEVVALSKKADARLRAVRRQDVEKAREELKRGYILRQGTLESEGMCTVGVPLRDGERILAAITIAGPATRWNERRVGACIASIRAGAAEVSRLLARA